MTAELAIVPTQAQAPDLTSIERVVITGDLSKLTPDERWNYYRGVCSSVGLNPFTQPFLYITLSGKLTLYATKGAADQLRDHHHISISQPKIDLSDGLCIVTVTATDKSGRTDSDLGIVPCENLRGDAKANAILKAVTKAKRRVTLSMCGLGMLDETEVETIPSARPANVETIPQHALAGDIGETPNLDAQLKQGRQDEAPEATPEFVRVDAEIEYKRLRNTAVRAGHPKSSKLKETLTSSLTDAVLVASIQSLEKWFAAEQAKQDAAPSDDSEDAPF